MHRIAELKLRSAMLSCVDMVIVILLILPECIHCYYTVHLGNRMNNSQTQDTKF